MGQIRAHNHGNLDYGTLRPEVSDKLRGRLEMKKCDQNDQLNHNNRKGVCYAFVMQNDFWRREKVSDSSILLGNLKNGAGEGNRTLISFPQGK
jgi:hypothetical protein